MDIPPAARSAGDFSLAYGFFNRKLGEKRKITPFFAKISRKTQFLKPSGGASPAGFFPSRMA
jgi:hypothetical protein